MTGSNFLTKFKRPKPGFTLIELLVVLGVFSVFVLIITNIFILALSSQRQTAARDQVLSNLRYITESISQRVRTSEINYDYYNNRAQSGIQYPETELALKDQDGNDIRYYAKAGELKMSVNGQEASFTNSWEVKIIKVVFYVNPPTNPFVEEKCNGALMPTGCQPSATCTLNEGQFKTGYCSCQSNSDCATKNCDSGEGVCLPLNIQPRVTIDLAFQSVGVKAEEQKTIYLQTTVSSRIYKR